MADTLVHGCGNPQRVVPPGKDLNHLDEPHLARLVVRPRQDVEQRIAQYPVRVELAKCRAEPRAVGRISALLEEAETHDVADEPRREDA